LLADLLDDRKEKRDINKFFITQSDLATKQATIKQGTVN